MASQTLKSQQYPIIGCNEKQNYRQSEPFTLIKNVLSKDFKRQLPVKESLSSGCRPDLLNPPDLPVQLVQLVQPIQPDAPSSATTATDPQCISKEKKASVKRKSSTKESSAPKKKKIPATVQSKSPLRNSHQDLPPNAPIEMKSPIETDIPVNPKPIATISFHSKWHSDDPNQPLDFKHLYTNANRIPFDGTQIISKKEHSIRFQWIGEDESVIKEVEVSTNLLCTIKIRERGCDFFKNIKLNQDGKELSINYVRKILQIVHANSCRELVVINLIIAVHEKVIKQWAENGDIANFPIDYWDKFKVSLSFKREIEALHWSNEGQAGYLDDNVINCYMQLIAERNRSNEMLPKVAVIDTHFFMSPNTRFSSAKFRGKNVCEYDLILCPVYGSAHWSLAVFHVKLKTVKHYDSEKRNNTRRSNILRGYLNGKGLTDWTVEDVPGIPKQDNGYDCGVFTCMYAEYVTRNQPLSFGQQNMPYFRKKMIYEICVAHKIMDF